MNKEDEIVHGIAQVWAAHELQTITDRMSLLDKSEITVLTPEKDSLVHKMNEKTEGGYGSHLLSLFRIAVDALEHAIILYSKDEPSLYAHFVLARTAIECTSEGLWIMTAGTEQKKAFYTLKQLFFEFKNAQEIYSSIPGEDLSKTEGELLKSLDRCKNNLPDYKTRSLGEVKKDRIIGRVPTSTIVINGDAAFRKGHTRNRFDGLWAWKMCSAVTHGNTLISETVSEHVELSIADRVAMKIPEDDSLLREKLSPRATLTALILEPAVENLEMFAELLSAQVEAPRTSTDR